jgi:cytochrome c-type biogenesis protein CcmH/NrfG
VIATAAYTLRSAATIWQVVRKQLKERFNANADDLFAASDYDGLLSLCGETLRERPGDVNALWFQGKAYFALERYEEARDCFERVTKVEPAWTESARPYMDAIEERNGSSMASASRSRRPWPPSETHSRLPSLTPTTARAKIGSS